ncbi:sodium:solute symporter family protein [Oceanobacillus jeddahense]|uniref:Na+:solute symporter n=1 Tax=Oceanobacillus jeddahense TaxID=1462527 RepID=A0ABY5JQA8_9BACI|nr:sodium:solute symporter family protein [Oceanobacillus jeddahense]UUI02493.1 Na+:solute symporter [Oceanobacillus jeddahense]
MQGMDWLVIALFFILMVLIGVWSYRRIRGSGDFYTAGGKLPWWLSGISHHVSGYSGAVFTGYAAIAYTNGFTIYVWWALVIAVAVIIGAHLIAPKWANLRINYNVESPTEYLSIRYNLFTQQLMAWSGVILKLFDVGAKWAAIGILLNIFTGLPLIYGVLISGVVSLIYITIGGLWADVWTDFAQFLIQVVAAVIMFLVVMNMMGGVSSLAGIWSELPATHSQWFSEPYTLTYVLVYFFVVFLSYNGGTWNLAARYISSPSSRAAKKGAYLSGILYLIFPLIMFFPMWAAPLIIPGIEDPSQSYGLLAMELLPAGLVGLVLAGLFAATMSMTSSDANTISAVITRDILPNLSDKFKNLTQKQGLRIGRITTFVFTFLTLLIGIQNERFGGVIGLIIEWFGALIGPISVPMILGLLPAFKHSNEKAAISSVFAGLLTFIITKIITVPLSISVGAPVIVSLIVFIGLGFVNRNKPIRSEVEELVKQVNKKD